MAIILIKDAEGYNSPAYQEYMIDTEADLASIDVTQCAIGSVAYTCKPGEYALDRLWMLGTDGTSWVEM